MPSIAKCYPTHVGRRSAGLAALIRSRWLNTPLWVSVNKVRRAAMRGKTGPSETKRDQTRPRETKKTRQDERTKAPTIDENHIDEEILRVRRFDCVSGVRRSLLCA
jgi:hypothetical protein